jgi:hypothetical protein
MPTKERAMSKAAEMARHASETHALVKKNADEGQGVSGAAEVAREAGETHVLVKECPGRTG